MTKNIFSQFKMSYPTSHNSIDKKKLRNPLGHLPIQKKPISIKTNDIWNKAKEVGKEIGDEILDAGKEVVEGVKKVTDVNYGDMGDTPFAKTLQDNPEVLKSIGDALEVIGSLTGQPEISIGGIIFKSGVEASGKDTVTGKIGTVAKGAGKISGDKSLEKIGKEIDKASKLETTLLNKINKNQSDIINQNAKENETLTQAVQNDKVIIDEDLQKIQNVEKKEEDNLERIATTLDKPTSLDDMIRDLTGFETEQGRRQYIFENFNIFGALNPMEKSKLLKRI